MIEQKIGQFILLDEPVMINENRKSCEIVVANNGERTIQIGSHFHFFEVNKALTFNRELAFCMHLDIPSGTAVRFSPGQVRTVRLVEYGGSRMIVGFNGLTNGCADDDGIRTKAFEKARKLGFIKEGL